VRFDFDPNNITMATNDSFAPMSMLNAALSTIAGIEFGYDGSDYLARAACRNDGAGYNYSSNITLTDDWHSIELIWIASSGAGDNNGSCEIVVDEGTSESVTGVDNDLLSWGTALLGATQGVDAGTDGTIYFDNYETLVFRWEYWNGTSWDRLTISETTADVDSLEASGTFYFDAPGNWFRYSVNGPTDLYYIRGHLEGGSYTTDPVEDMVKTDILLLQYLSNVTSEDQTFVVVPEYLWIWFGMGPAIPLVLRGRKRYLESRVG
jgi:hypothetical protein